MTDGARFFLRGLLTTDSSWLACKLAPTPLIYLGVRTVGNS